MSFQENSLQFPVLSSFMHFNDLNRELLKIRTNIYFGMPQKHLSKKLNSI